MFSVLLIEGMIFKIFGFLQYPFFFVSKLLMQIMFVNKILIVIGTLITLKEALVESLPTKKISKFLIIYPFIGFFIWIIIAFLTSCGGDCGPSPHGINIPLPL